MIFDQIKREGLRFRPAETRFGGRIRERTPKKGGVGRPVICEGPQAPLSCRCSCTTEPSGQRVFFVRAIGTSRKPKVFNSRCESLDKLSKTGACIEVGRLNPEMSIGFFILSEIGTSEKLLPFWALAVALREDVSLQLILRWTCQSKIR